jgi:drug/metabolite transporter (DMT)-like permease
MKPHHIIRLIILSALWGSSFLFLRIAAPEFGAIPLIALRASIAALCLFPFLVKTGEVKIMLANAPAIFLLGLTSTAIPFSLMAYATLYATAGYTSILNAMTPMLTALVAYLWLHDKLSRAAIIGIVIGFMGVAILITDKTSVDAAHLFKPAIAMLLGTTCYAITACFTKRHFHHVSALVIAAGSQLCAAIALIPLAIYLWPTTPVSVHAWGSAVALGTACTGIALIIYFKLIKEVGVSKTVSVTYLIPVFSMLWGYFFLNESITLTMLIGAAVIFLGVALTTEMMKLKRK